MGLRDLVESDLGALMEDSAQGFGWPITVTDPAGNTANLTGISGDIGQVIDPDTGTAVTGRLAHVALRTSTMATEGLQGMPYGVHDTATKPWVVVFDDIGGSSWTFKVQQSMPDRTVGLVLCILELYQ